MSKFSTLRPHMIHFARLRGELHTWYVNDIIKRSLYSAEAWNHLMSLIYAS
jgi:hypothetical protein